MARSLRPRFRQQQRRKTSWIGGALTPTTAQSIGVATTAIVLSFDTRTVASISAPFTIIRLRGELVIYSDQKAADEDPFGAIGAMIVSGEAFDGGAATVPAPYTESFYDSWFYHQYWAAPNVANAGSNAVASFDFPHYTVDSKAMRKVGDGDVFVCVLENKSAAHAAAYTLNFRMLVKLH